ncbi:RDD domain containing protein [Crinalium epipsammum PCC 9333]|uniref:RDD domain containing protein n=1 Tax=Crinalium epipsammum PCC 9333 TaxID=1173022 RepID=K9VYS8_9CYAN|nr:RDD family protein [Crinalium epipsammum]AFZ13293.1 RDD domain containing protein [Crinalium epipsammum PCC 9333]
MDFFNRVTVQTPESVELEFTLAGIGNRAYALLIDYIVLGLTITLFWIAWAIFAVGLIDVLTTQLGNSNSVRLWLIAIAILLNFFIYTGYFVFFEVLWQGQTPGKRYAKIRVIRDDGRRVGIQQATLRTLLRLIDDTLFIGAFLIMLGRQEKRLGDWAAGTLVIQEEYLVAATNFPISEQAQQLATQLSEIANLSQLLPDDFAAIREFLQRRQGMTSQAKADLSLQLARQIKTIISLEKLPTALTAEVFLEAVYLAYQLTINN